MFLSFYRYQLDGPISESNHWAGYLQTAWRVPWGGRSDVEIGALMDCKQLIVIYRPENQPWRAPK